MESMKSQVTDFLNIDLRVRTRSRLNELLEELGHNTFVIHKSTNEASLELKIEHEDLEDTITKMVKAIQAFPPKVKTIWDECERREMDIGIQAGSEPHETSFVLPEKVVAMLAGIKVQIRFTVYACPR